MERPSMNIGMKNRVLALGLVLTFLTPVFPAFGTSAGGGAGGAEGAGHVGGRAAPDHNASIAVDLTKASLQNVALRPGYGARLAGTTDYTVQSQFPVTSGDARIDGPHEAVNSRGNTLVAWTEKAATFGVRAACFAPNGNMIGSTISLAGGNGTERWPAVAVDSSDGFVVVWVDFHNMSSAYLYGQFFDPDGNRSGSPVQLTDPGASMAMPSVAAGPDGGFAVAWLDYTIENAYLQRFDSGLNRVGPEINAIPYYDISTSFPSVEVAENTNGSILVVAAESIDNFPLTYFNMIGQWFDSNGNKVGSKVTFLSSNVLTRSQPSLSAAPDGDFMIAWESTARWYNESGVQLGGDIALPGDAPSVAVCLDGSFIAAYSGIGFDLKARLYDHWGNEVGPEMTLGSDISNNMIYIISLAPDDSFSFVWYTTPAMSEYDLSAVRGIRPYKSMGTLETGELVPSNLIAWTAVDMFATIPNPASNSLILSLSTDHGTTWSPLPSNGSLASAGNAASIRFKVTFGTLDSSTSPILHGLVAGYIQNRPPTVSLPSDINAWTNTLLNITANGSDPDGDALVYTWTQESGPALGINGTNGLVLPFTAPAAGIYKLGVTAHDGFNDSPPAYIYLMVTDRPYVPTLTVSSPIAGQLVNTTTLTVAFTVKDYNITQTGGHIHYQLDSAAEVMWFSTAPFNLTGLTEGNHTLRVYLADANHTRLPNPESYVTVNFTVGDLPRMPDLSITNSDLKLKPSSPKDGDSVTLSVTVHNTGTSDAGVFAVRFLVDGEALPDQNVVLLAKGDTTVVETKWKATGGSHNISVQANPGGGLLESTLSNNGASVRLSVKKAEPGGAPMLLFGMIALIMIVVVAVLAVMMIRRRKPTIVVQYQPPALAPPPASVQPFPPPAQGPPKDPSRMPPGPASAPPPGPSPSPQAPPGPQPPPVMPPEN